MKNKINSEIRPQRTQDELIFFLFKARFMFEGWISFEVSVRRISSVLQRGI